MKEHKSYLEPSIMAVGFIIQEMIEKGWKIDPDKPLVQDGWQYAIGFVRDSEVVQQEKQSTKLSRAEILEKARNARAAQQAVKKLQEGNNG